MLMKTNNLTVISLDFANIYYLIIPMKDFGLRYRFTDDKNLNFPWLHFNQIKALDKSALTFLSNYIVNLMLHKNVLFKASFSIL